MEEVKLFGTWFSPFSCRVIWAPKLKGIPYEYVEEDLSNKSPMLLQYNPVHKKIPVLVHGGEPICDSMVILQYIEEIWPHNPLLPNDPRERAKARFWVKFAEEKGPNIWRFFCNTGREQEDALKNTLEMLKALEDHALGEKTFFGGDSIGMADMAFAVVAHWLGAYEEITGIKVMEPERFPRLHQWIKNFKQVPVIEDSLPNHGEMVLYFKSFRQKLLASP